jgi:uncharacterized RDD family membrane protein YckC
MSETEAERLSHVQVGAAQAQASAALRIRGEQAIGPPKLAYIGFATRAIAFVIDVVVIDFVASVAWLSASLVLGLLHVPSTIHDITFALLAVASVLWAIGYFVGFWSMGGQTLGSRLLQIRVRDAGDRGNLKPRRALLRLGALVLAMIPFGAGLVRIFYDDRRRGFHDRVASTVVVDAPRYSEADIRRLARQPTVNGNAPD